MAGHACPQLYLQGEDRLYLTTVQENLGSGGCNSSQAKQWSVVGIPHQYLQAV